ncbi:hypothetical protein SAMN04487785_101221 [Dyella jiangningensis]|nr:hypothetical protein BDW41_103350 [Dyella sp. AtDHG13]SDJ21798.1 hypothetical protein SAMN04487785_101221 [Dyella jiangningensis]
MKRMPDRYQRAMGIVLCYLVFAVQGQLGIHGLDQRWASVDTMTAIRTPLEQSGTQWSQAAEQAGSYTHSSNKRRDRHPTEPDIGMAR